MDKKKQKAIIDRLSKAGIEAVKIELTSGLGVKVSTDYEGPYAPKESFDILDTCRRRKGKAYEQVRNHRKNRRTAE